MSKRKAVQNHLKTLLFGSLPYIAHDYIFLDECFALKVGVMHGLRTLFGHRKFQYYMNPYHLHMSTHGPTERNI